MCVGSCDFICGVCYRPPSYTVDNNALLDHLQSCLDKINVTSNTVVLLLGDFNAHYD